MAYAIKNVRTEGYNGPWKEYRYDFIKDGNKVNEWWFDIDGHFPTLDDLRKALLKMKRVDESFYCLDCNIHTGESDEYYMVIDEVWLLANPADHGMLCIGCLENRLQRELVPSDFTDYPVNSDFNKSDRLRKRLGYGVEDEVEVS